MIIKEFPILYSRNKKKMIQQWSIRVVQDGNNDPVIEIRHGQKDGKMITDERMISVLNRRHKSLIDQALFAAESRWNHKREREHYSEDQEATQMVISPMLAKTYENGKHLRAPFYVQPKIDGIRCVARWEEGGVSLRTRTNARMVSPYLERIRSSLLSFCRDHPSLVLDGELFSDDIPFEELSGLCRQESQDREKDVRLIYCIFDVICLNEPGLDFQDRMCRLLLPDIEDVKIVPTFLVGSTDEAMERHAGFIRDGYEGIIFRNRDAPYQMSRSWDLQKHKVFLEEEFPIAGYSEGEGKDRDTVIWECTAPNGKRFSVRPRGSREFRARLLRDAPFCIGRPLTVVFQEYTHDGLPRFPVGKTIRGDT